MTRIKDKSTLHNLPPCRGVATGDAGLYECQVSTEQKMSRFVHLGVMGEWSSAAGVTLHFKFSNFLK